MSDYFSCKACQAQISLEPIKDQHACWLWCPNHGVVGHVKLGDANWYSTNQLRPITPAPPSPEPDVSGTGPLGF